MIGGTDLNLNAANCQKPVITSHLSQIQESCDDWIVASTETVLTSVPDEVEEDLRASTINTRPAALPCNNSSKIS